MTMYVLLGLTAVLVLIAAVLFIESFRRHVTFHALAGMSVLIIAAIPAVPYAGITSQIP